MTDAVIPAEVEPLAGQANRAALALQRLGFRILHVGTTISVQGPLSLWASTFKVAFEPQVKRVMADLEGREVTYYRASTERVRLPPGLEDVIADVFFVEPPEFV